MRPVSGYRKRPASSPSCTATAPAVRSRTVPAVLLPVAEALPLLTRARHDPAAHPAAACWGAAALHALRLAARGRLLPGLTADRPRRLARGPARRRTTSPTCGPSPPPCPYEGARRPPARAAARCGCPSRRRWCGRSSTRSPTPCPARPPRRTPPGRRSRPRGAQRLPGARDWAAEVAAGMDAGVRVSLRLDLSAYELFDDGGGATARSAAPARPSSRCTASPTRPSWPTRRPCGRATADRGLRAARPGRRRPRAAPRRPRLAAAGPAAEQDVPDVLALSEDELYDLLGVGRDPAGRRRGRRALAAGARPYAHRHRGRTARRPARRPTAPASSTARTCSGSAGSWRSAATR